MKLSLFRSSIVVAIMALVLPLQAWGEDQIPTEDTQTEAVSVEVKGCFECMKDQYRRSHPLASPQQVERDVAALMSSNGKAPNIGNTDSAK